jgi:trehalose-6-phosphatase
MLKDKHPELFYKILPTSYEVWPPLEWDKSNGLEQIFLANKWDLNDALVLYMGDSDSDEPAFNWTNKHKGISIRISPDKVKSQAQFRIAGPKDVQEIVELLIAKIEQLS